MQEWQFMAEVSKVSELLVMGKVAKAAVLSGVAFVSVVYEVTIVCVA